MKLFRTRKQATQSPSRDGWIQQRSVFSWIDLRKKSEKTEFNFQWFFSSIITRVMSAWNSWLEIADQLEIKMIFLYPNSTFLMQPADVAIFRCLKSLWREENRVARNNQVSITKQNFASLFINAFEKIPPNVIKTGFFKSGIFPWDSSNIDYSKCLGKKNSRKLLCFLLFNILLFTLVNF